MQCLQLLTKGALPYTAVIPSEMQVDVEMYAYAALP